MRLLELNCSVVHLLIHLSYDRALNDCTQVIMYFNDKLNTAGEHALIFQGQVGDIEAILTVPQHRYGNYAAIIGHPNSLQGGSMSNKVVTTLARTFKELGIPSLRFNFRGVGASMGTYDAGLGESTDMLQLCKLWSLEEPQVRLIFAGFSFGSYVTYRAAAQYPHELLISVAPAIHMYDYSEFKPNPAPWLILQGDEDEVVPPQIVFDFAAHAVPEIPVIRFAQTTHFFHGKLIELRERLTHSLKEYLEQPGC